ncbi:MAG: hypothetical protein OEY89_02700 [Gammaproteobacteria bacterium]|nr:hypothetical protein [Gammaproteobacteria bacterium]
MDNQMDNQTPIVSETKKRKTKRENQDRGKPDTHHKAISILVCK